KPKIGLALPWAVFVFLVACSARETLAGDVASPSPKNAPKVAHASDEGERAIKQFKAPKDFKVELIAAEPPLSNPVSLWIDERGNIDVAETFRLNDNVPDIRGHMDWLDEDLASQSVEDRVTMLKKHLGKKVSDLTRDADRLKLIIVGNDGKA